MQYKDITVLVCDDSILMRKKTKDVFISLGCENFIEAADGRTAVDLYKQNRPELVLMDIVMPVLNGVDSAAEILEFDKAAKIIMVSSMGTRRYIQQSMLAGAEEFLQKPIKREKAEQMLQEVLNGGS